MNWGIRWTRREERGEKGEESEGLGERGIREGRREGRRERGHTAVCPS